MKFKPYPYQQYCIDRIVNDSAVGLFLDMGLGKTVITLSAIRELKYNRWAVSKALIIAPKKVAEGTWTEEARKWEHLQGIRISVVTGSKISRLKALAKSADVYVISRDNAAWLADYYRQDWPFDMVVLDESSSFKNSRSKRFKALKAVRSRITRFVELTGTPSSNGLIDLWAQIYLLDGGARLGRTLGAYRERFFDPDKRSRTQIYTYAPKNGSPEYIERVIGDICVSMRAEDYIELPDLIYDNVPVVLDTAAQKAYTKLEREMLLETPDGDITAGTAGVLTGKLLQLCNGAAYADNGGYARIHDCKINALLETLERLNGKSVLLFYAFRHDVERITRVLKPLGLRVRVYAGPEDREDWNAGKIDVLLAHPASCAYGLNLQRGGHHAIWFGLTWSLEQYEQANKRLHRQGQKKPVIVHHLLTRGGMDEDVLNALHVKADMQGALMTALKARIKRAKGG